MNTEQEAMLIETNTLVKRIVIILIGDEFEKKGLIEEHNKYEDKIGSLEQTRRKNKWTIGIVASIATVSGTIIGLIIKLTN